MTLQSCKERAFKRLLYLPVHTMQGEHPDVRPQVVAFANLLPEEGQADDLDSYMFQTVGHQVLTAYARCCGLPLLRRRISGGSINQVWSGKQCSVAAAARNRAPVNPAPPAVLSSLAMKFLSNALID